MTLPGRRSRLLLGIALMVLAVAPHLADGRGAAPVGATVGHAGHVMQLDIESVGLIPAMMPSGADAKVTFREEGRRLLGATVLAGVVVAVAVAAARRRRAGEPSRRVRRGVWAGGGLVPPRAPPAVRV